MRHGESSMFSYVVAFLAFLVLYNPIVQMLSPAPAPVSRIHRMPRPRVNEALLALEEANWTALRCPEDSYSVHIASKEPLVVYIENFLAADERSHLLEIR